MVGFLFIYLWDYFQNRFIKKMNGKDAYYALKAEKEAYKWDADEDYLSSREKDTSGFTRIGMKKRKKM